MPPETGIMISKSTFITIDIFLVTLLRAFPSKAACELGYFLSASAKTKFPKKLAKYLMKKAERAEEAEKSREKGNPLESEEESAIRAFIIAIGRTWSMEQCAVYTCSVILFKKCLI